MKGLAKSNLFLIILAIVYVVMPVDVIPELVTGPLGLTDDAAAIAMIAALVMRARGRDTTAATPVPVVVNE